MVGGPARSVTRAVVAALFVALIAPAAALATDPSASRDPGTPVPEVSQAEDPAAGGAQPEPSATPIADPVPTPTPTPVPAPTPIVPEASKPPNPIDQNVQAADVATSTVVTTSNTNVARDWYRILVATVNPAPGGGQVEWRVDGVLVETDQLEPGLASVEYYFGNGRDVGSYSVQATFTGTDGFTSSASTPVVLTVIQQSVTLASSADPAPVNTAVTFTVTVVPNPGYGDVVFSFPDGDVTVPVDANGVATTSKAFSSGGQYFIEGDFQGNDDFPHRGDAMYQDVSWDAVVLDVTGSTPQPYGDLTALAAVTPNPGGGSVKFRPGWWASWTEVALGPDGTVALDLGETGMGTYTFEFEFSGYGSYGSATDTLQIEVWNKSTTTVATNRTTAVKGELPVVLTATVGSTPSALEGGGTVTFDDVVGGVHASLGPVSINPEGKATFSTSSLRVGTHAIRAVFSGSPGFVGSTSAPVAVVVSADTSVNASYKADPANFYPAKDGFRDTVKLGGNLNEKATITVRVYNSAGTLKRTFSVGTKLAGAWSVSWNGRTSSGAALPAGKYKTVASFKDVPGNTKKITVYTNLSWRKATWKSATITRYGDQLAYYVGAAGGAIYYSPDYSRGRTLDSAEMDRDCDPCALAAGEAVFQLTSAGLGYRYIHIEVHGHGYVDREHPGTWYLENPKNGNLEAPLSLPEYEQSGVTYERSVSTGYISSTKKVTAVLWMTQQFGDAFDIHYLKMRYQYAVLQ